MLHAKACEVVPIGLVLIVLGVFFLLARLMDTGVLTLPLLSALLIAVGLLRRESAWFIPGGILAGIGLGAFLVEALPLAPVLSDEAEGGVFLLSFALGWVGVFALSSRFGDEKLTWALIPALVMTVIGGLLLSAGVGARILEGLSYAWPLALVGFGAYLLFRGER
ncbi:hypothetical protein [Truepera radiovictrix]|uniref:DUF5668 domain-containing protein n=1 Tax=Truepera radiovictrix (strain DSM 17093 / CIP 108686 / LMG 22925 / RQ-24) TaxID=649638 RepID=D7CTS1_TRURR|nr:hypothetical protein [Truepera radiovictrix]ADI15618.1 conserved hypothetical protein [Truepera radiovictrix DSM 17093]WMT58753.1 hypothetical protein RCV51_07350 [Truepera radiovictrix]